MAPRTLAIISDTHLPRGRRKLPDACVDRLHAADLIIHAGDLMTVETLAALGEYGDDAGVRARLPERRELTVEAVRLGVLHDAGPSRGRLDRLHAAFPDADAVIFGHSHIPLHERDPADGFQILNPGSPTDKRRQPHLTMGWARVLGAAISFEILELD
jgi:putative phosphoesterase